MLTWTFDENWLALLTLLPWNPADNVAVELNHTEIYIVCQVRAEAIVQGFLTWTFNQGHLTTKLKQKRHFTLNTSFKDVGRGRSDKTHTHTYNTKPWQGPLVEMWHREHPVCRVTGWRPPPSNDLSANQGRNVQLGPHQATGRGGAGQTGECGRAVRDPVARCSCW